MCQGLPGSGKSHWAFEQKFADPSGVEIVNKDDIRLDLEATGWQWSHENEKAVIAIRDFRIRDAFGSGFTTVISSDTNFGSKHKVQLERIARECGAVFETRVFDTSVDDCIRRDAQRQGKARVGEEVIRKMAAQYGVTASKGTVTDTSFLHVVTPDPSLMPAIICDLDGTLSLFQRKGHRGPYDATLCDQDEVNVPVLKTIRAFNNLFYQIIYLSGRFDTYRPQTLDFFNKQACPPGPLHMRKAGDTRKDYIIKGELFDAHVRGKYNVLFVLDDRTQVVDAWRRLGLTVFQVAPGDF
jgi:predicted kinase